MLLPGYDPIATAEDAWFDPGKAELVLAFFAARLKHVEGSTAGKPFVPEPWEQSILANLFGWQRRDSHGRTVRRYRESLIYVPRKNGKTPLAAGCGIFVLYVEHEAGQQNYIGAEDRPQANKLFRHAELMVKQDPELGLKLRAYGGDAPGGQARSLVRIEDSSFLQIISAAADSQHGSNTHLGIIDELHTQKDRELVDVLQTSFASDVRAQPLFLCLTTAATKGESICNEKYDYACKVRDGLIRDPQFLPVIYEASEKDDWTDEAVWAKANPNLGVSVSLDYLRREAKRAQAIPAFENTFRRLHLNIRTTQDVRAIPMQQWDACTSCPPEGAKAWRAAMLEYVAGKTCWGGLDLASTIDLAALVLLFPDEEAKRLIWLSWFWVPEEGAKNRSRRDQVPYEHWIAEGWITATPGNRTDYDRIRATYSELGKRFRIRNLGADTWNAVQLLTQLKGDGFDVTPVGQGFKSLTGPTKELLALVADGRIDHGWNPVLRWNASNLATEEDAAGNLKPTKARSAEKIDGIVAGLNALAVYLARPAANDEDWYRPGDLTA
jgi:phage terminase large subunit-like protein